MKILVAIDHSAASNTAVAEVAARPWPPDATFEVLSVADPSSDDENTQGVVQQALVQQAADRLAARGLTVTHLVLPGDPKTAIVERAREMGAALIVIGPHGASGLTGLLLGSVAKAVLRAAPCSVELVRAISQADPKLLLATDGSEFSLAAAGSLAARPWPLGTEVRVLSVVEYHLPFLQATLEPPFINPSEMEHLREQAMKAATDAIQQAEEIVLAAGLKTSERVSVLIEPPQDVIVYEAQQWGADLIVLGSHGHRGIERLLIGSVSEAVAMHAECSVEVIRP